MFRLTAKAYSKLSDEVRRLTGDDPLMRAQREIVLKRLLVMRDRVGPLLTEAEIKELILDLLPGCNPAVIKQAASLNRPVGPARKIVAGTLIGAGAIGLGAGLIAFLNLPYPMIRWPVAKVMPIILLPSFMEMDHNYRQVVSLVEQSDQLVNQATSAADIKLGAQKVDSAQKSLDKLPVWFLGYYPQMYCQWMTCSWQFTKDEFLQARQKIGRMDAKIFQEDQAMTTFQSAEDWLTTAKASYLKLKQPAAIGDWQRAIDQLEQLPQSTLAYRLANTKLEAYQRDFKSATSVALGQRQATTMLDIAKAYATTASAASQNPPHPSEVWERAAKQWELAIDRLEQVEPGNPGYGEAQILKATYQGSLGTVELRFKQEELSRQSLKIAEALYSELLSQQGQSIPKGVLHSTSQKILDVLQDVRSGSTAEAKANDLKKAVLKLLK
jgi:hypothetical protein